MIQVLPDWDDPIIKIISVQRATVAPPTQDILLGSTPTYEDTSTGMEEHLYSDGDIETLIAELQTFSYYETVVADLKRMLQILSETQGAYIRMVS